MTWPAGIAITAGLIAALLILIHQHRQHGTEHTDPQDGERS